MNIEQMNLLSEVAIKEAEVTQELADSRDRYLDARIDYELSLRKFSLFNVKKCPCCFKGFYKDKENEIIQEYANGDSEPNEIEVLERMAMTPVLDSHDIDDHSDSN